MAFKCKLFLLSETEFRRYEDKLGDYEWWWLRTPAGTDDTGKAFVKVVIENKQIVGCYTADSCNVRVRPAIYVHPELIGQLPHVPRDKNKVLLGYLGGKIEWIVADKRKGLLVADFLIDYRLFDDAINDFEKSKINDFLKSVYSSMGDKNGIMDALINGEESSRI